MVTCGAWFWMEMGSLWCCGQEELTTGGLWTANFVGERKLPCSSERGRRKGNRWEGGQLAWGGRSWHWLSRAKPPPWFPTAVEDERGLLLEGVASFSNLGGRRRLDLLLEPRLVAARRGARPLRSTGFLYFWEGGGRRWWWVGPLASGRGGGLSEWKVGPLLNVSKKQQQFHQMASSFFTTHNLQG